MLNREFVDCYSYIIKHLMRRGTELFWKCIAKNYPVSFSEQIQCSRQDAKKMVVAHGHRFEFFEKNTCMIEKQIIMQKPEINL